MLGAKSKFAQFFTFLSEMKHTFPEWVDKLSKSSENKTSRKVGRKSG